MKNVFSLMILMTMAAHGAQAADPCPNPTNMDTMAYSVSAGSVSVSGALEAASCGKSPAYTGEMNWFNAFPATLHVVLPAPKVNSPTVSIQTYLQDDSTSVGAVRNVKLTQDAAFYRNWIEFDVAGLDLMVQGSPISTLTIDFNVENQGQEVYFGRLVIRSVDTLNSFDGVPPVAK